MEEKLLKIFKLADLINEKQDKAYVEIYYSADDKKRLEIAIRSKENFTYKEKHGFELANTSLINWDNIIQLLENYINGGSANE